MRILIAYDKEGTIVDCAKVHQAPNDWHPFAELEEGHRVLAFDDPPETLEKFDLAELPKSFRIDVKNQSLVKQG